MTLTQNYRASPQLIAASNSLANHFVERREKELEAVSNEDGEIHIYKHKDETHEGISIAKTLKQLNKNGILFSEMAVLARTNALPSELVTTLLLQGVPVALRNGSFHNPYAKQLITALGIPHHKK